MSGLLAAAALALLQLQADPPRVATGVQPDTVTVGDRFRSYVRLRVPPGARVQFDPIPPGDPLQQVDSVRVLAERGSFGAAYPLVAWTPGVSPATSATLRVTLPDGRSARYRVALRLPHVRSVLPADSSALRPKPAKGLLSEPRGGSPWRWALIALAAAAGLAALVWRARRPRRATPPPDPRAVALQELDRLRARAPVGGSEVAPLYTEVVRVLRGYLAALDPRWGEDRSGEELVRGLATAGVPHDAVRQLAELLRGADPVRFGGAAATAAEASRFCTAAREWVERPLEPFAEAERSAA